MNLKYRDKLFVLSIFTILSICFALLSAFISVSISKTLQFGVFQIGLLFLPGMAAVVVLFSKRKFKPLVFLTVSYAAGYAINILEYFVSAAIGLSPASVTAISIIVTIMLITFSAVKINRGTGTEIILSCKKELPYLIIGILFLLLIFFGYSANYTVPNESSPVKQYHADALFWIENAAALKKGFPPEEFRLSGTQLYYHYFASIWLAFTSLITKIDVFQLGYALYPLGKCLLLFGGLYTAAQVWFEKERDRILFLIILLFTTGYEKWSIINYTAHIVTLPFGFDIAHAYGAYFLAGLFWQYKNKTTSVPIIIATTVSFLMCAGHKAPLAMIYLVFAGVLCLYWLIGKQFVKAFANGIAVLTSFTFVMVVCVGFLTGAESRVNAGKFTHCGLLMASPLYESYQTVALSNASAITKLLAYFTAMGKLILSVHPLILFLVISGIAVMIVRKKLDILDGALLATFIAGSLMGLFNYQEGVSQMYYLMAAFVPGVLFGLRNYSYLTERFPKTAKSVFSIFLCMSLILFFFTGGITLLVKKGVSATFSEPIETKEQKKENALQWTDYQALCWIRDNTPTDAVIVTDRSVLLDIDNYMYYGTFAERANYLEGDRYFYGTYLEERENRRETIKSLYANSTEALETLKKAGISYIVQTKWLTPEYDGLKANKEFETESVAVWRIE